MAPFSSLFTIFFSNIIGIASSFWDHPELIGEGRCSMLGGKSGILLD